MEKVITTIKDFNGYEIQLVVEEDGMDYIRYKPNSKQDSPSEVLEAQKDK